MMASNASVSDQSDSSHMMLQQSGDTRRDDEGNACRSPHQLHRGSDEDEDADSSMDPEIVILRRNKLRLKTARHDVSFFIDPWEFFTVKTMENMHTYLWITKDLSWTLCWYWPGLVFGSIAIFLSFMILLGSLWTAEYSEMWHNMAQMLWLLANFVWMTGDLHDWQYPNSPSVYASRCNISANIMIAALCWLSVYYLILRPFRLLPEKADYSILTHNHSAVSRSLWFKSWR